MLFFVYVYVSVANRKQNDITFQLKFEPLSMSNIRNHIRQFPISQNY